MEIEMNKSFLIDHTKFGEGLYISRVDGDITTYDMRFYRPNGGEYLSDISMHTFEHMFSTYIRNTELDVIYFGPMGCRTGFYLLCRNAENSKVIAQIKNSLERIIDHNGGVFGASKEECGHFRCLDLNTAKFEAERYLKILHSKNIDFKYYQE